MALQVAFIDVANPLFVTLAAVDSATPEELAERAGVDRGYVARWCDAAFAFGYLDEVEGKLRLTDLGRAFLPETPGTTMPFAVQAMLSAHIAERAATFMKSGERPGERVLAERESILPLFGPMLETTFSAMFEQQILPNVAVYNDADQKSGVAVDLDGCPYCIGHTSGMLQEIGCSKAEVEGIEQLAPKLFSDQERLVLRFAEQATRDPARVSDELVAQLRQYFSEGEVVEVAAVVGLMNFTNKVHEALALPLEEKFVH